MSLEIQKHFFETLKFPLSISTIEFSSDKHLAGKQALSQTDYASHGYTSITHSGNLAFAVSTPKNDDICGIGIDLEIDRELNTRTARMFLSPKELSELENPSNEELLKLWTIKEAIFKSTPENNGLFLRNFEIKNRDSQKGSAFCINNPENEYVFSSLRIDAGIISVAICTNRLKEQLAKSSI